MLTLRMAYCSVLPLISKCFFTSIKYIIQMDSFRSKMSHFHSLFFLEGEGCGGAKGRVLCTLYYQIQQIHLGF